MRKNFSKVVLLVDRSGSMHDWLNDAQGLINNFLKEQFSNMEGTEVSFSLYHFDTVVEKDIECSGLYKDGSKVPSFTLKPNGGTALYDAMHEVITSVGVELAGMSEQDRPEKVVFVTLTDGYENASRKFRSEQVKALVKQQTDVYNWEFVYLGANQDAYAVGNSLGFKTSNVANYTMDSYQDAARGTSDMLKRYLRENQQIGYTDLEKRKMT